jgi:hypothetical protein
VLPVMGIDRKVRVHVRRDANGPKRTPAIILPSYSCHE